MKRVFSSKLAILVTMVLMISMFPTAVLAQDEAIQNDVGLSVETVDGNTLGEDDTLTTMNKMYEGFYTYSVYRNEATIYAYNGKEEHVVVPETLGGYDVVYISWRAFSDCDSLISVETPQTLSEIGSDAFWGCENLKKVTLNEGLQEIGQSAFQSCLSLESISIPDSVQKVGIHTFDGCSSLKSVRIGKGLTTIREGMFEYCSSLETVVLGKNIQAIDYFAFLDCSSLTSIIIPETVIHIDDPVFRRGPSDFTIYGGSGSYAESYALAKKFDFATIDTKAKVNYTTHVQNVGWQNYVDDGVMSGTSGKGLRLEGIEVVSGIGGLGVSYTTHVQNIGWQDYVSNGEMSGTSGKGLRLEGIRLQLTGEEVDKYDVYYRVHAQNVGWMGWAKNGADAGTAGYGYRLEGIEIQIVEKGAAAPGTTNNAFIQK